MREMKDSGIEWLGAIPKDWTVSSIGKISKHNTGKALNKKDTRGELKQYITTSNLYWGNFELDNLNEMLFEENEIERYSATKGDLLICEGGYIGRSAIWSYDYTVCLQNHIHRVRPYSHISVKFVYYCMFAFVETGAIRQFDKGICIQGMSSKALAEIKIPTPLKGKQIAIAEFLDGKCCKIDTLIENEEKAIAELKDAVRAVIRKYVKQGVYPHDIIKTNSVWFTDIPSDWELRRGKFVLEILNREVLAGDTVITCFRDGEVTLRSNRREDGFTIAEKEIGYQGVENGDLVIHGMDGFAGAIGISDARGKGSPVLNVCDSKENKKYLMYYLRCLAYDDVFTALSTGIRVRSCDLRWNKLANMDFALPSKQEQSLIVEKIEQGITKIKELIAVKQQKIAELKEYKKLLIYEYVTGKKAV